MNEEYILGVKVNTKLSMEDVIFRIDQMLADGKFHYITTTNPEFIIDAQRDPEFKDIINNSDLSLPDGSGVVQAEYFLKRIKELKSKKIDILFPVKAFWLGMKTGFSPKAKKDFSPRIIGVDLVYKICEYAEKNNKTIFLLGGRNRDRLGRFIEDDQEIAHLAGVELKNKFPALRLIGETSKFSHKEYDDKATVEYIHRCMSYHNLEVLDFLIVAYNHVNQEKWIVRNGYNIPAKMCLGVGGALDYLCNNKKRSPEVYIRLNIEWLYKFITQPWRFKRIFKAFPTFPLKIFLSSLTHN
ncbi:MAG TPA: WecB/TagA/CpsF family glycosyltransferase [Patescibacteria group bacterium]|nr:WecB/TagA/CpsF family glycosyltransferase [Patescibacteria group bacterium]